MVTLIFPGEQRKDNFSWLDEYVTHLGDGFNGIEYKHWDVGVENPKINFAQELGDLERLSFIGDVDTVIAKSAGTMVALYAIERGILDPSKVLFMGIPADADGKEIWSSYRKGLDGKTPVRADLIRLHKKHRDKIQYWQNELDPLSSSHGLIELLGNPNINVIKGGNDHGYSYKDMREIVNRFLNS